MITAAIDTNVIASSLLTPGGTCFRLMELVNSGQLVPVISPEVNSEYRRILLAPRLRRIHEMTDSEIDQFLGRLSRAAENVELAEIPAVVHADPTDDMLLATAVAGNAEFIVSGDKHLLDLGSWQGIEILPPAAMVAVLTIGDA